MGKSHINVLKGLRALLAILFFAPLLLYFVDFSGNIPEPRGMQFQIVPAVLKPVLWVILFHILLAVVGGRLYCSIICPAGVLQDIINRLYCIGKKKRKGAMRFKYHPPYNILRYTIAGATVIALGLGFTTLLALLDPYSNFGRIAANLFRPLVMWANNGAAQALESMDNYTLYQVTVKTATTAGIIGGATALLLFVVLTIWRGRLFCNTICPVGAVLSLLSKFSLLRITFDPAKCNSCGSCERTCKAEAVDSKAMTVDASRCVTCFNCTSSCPKHGLKYRFAPAFGKRKGRADSVEAEAPAADSSRRQFISTGVTVAASLPIISALAQHAETVVNADPTLDNIDYDNLGPVTPPGSLSLKQFRDKCTGCHICVVQCPTQVLRPAGFEFGIDYLLRPHCAFVSSYCNYDCMVCSEVCPSGAISLASVEDKHTTQVGIATFNKNRCVVHTNGTDCGACAEHCPTTAVHMVPYTGTLTIPQVEPELCIGCGGCESICPVRPLRAIVVVANASHQRIDPLEEEESEQIETEEFAF
ncbi:MAG: 4Fe-4S binding protein [Tannerellaceae bacterium]|jgi:ferredoxin|nr:4Fe-4S binding protein [Tannerellaceae bacterium]